MYEVDFIFVGGNAMSTRLPQEAIEKVKGLLTAGEPVTVTGTKSDTVVFPQNLVMIRVNK